MCAHANAGGVMYEKPLTREQILSKIGMSFGEEKAYWQWQLCKLPLIDYNKIKEVVEGRDK